MSVTNQLVAKLGDIAQFCIEYNVANLYDLVYYRYGETYVSFDVYHTGEIVYCVSDSETLHIDNYNINQSIPDIIIQTIKKGA